ncbi:hypothetical protein BP6252_10907 [Coleophoma cylindrospora]|uniref:Uncharacterized protein n=1 Tax=Coleophoma cylindrospora TaxID=1849047 RepID=A0A3D8QNI7_9HELO|nr:hypothetical protein BP6252_10907 [Coleophoma cylindrospora]
MTMTPLQEDYPMPSYEDDTDSPEDFVTIFQVLPNLPCDVIFGRDLLDELDAFNTCSELLDLHPDIPPLPEPPDLDCNRTRPFELNILINLGLKIRIFRRFRKRQRNSDLVPPSEDPPPDRPDLDYNRTFEFNILINLRPKIRLFKQFRKRRRNPGPAPASEDPKDRERCERWQRSRLKVPGPTLSPDVQESATREEGQRAGFEGT